MIYSSLVVTLNKFDVAKNNFFRLWITSPFFAKLDVSRIDHCIFTKKKKLKFVILSTTLLHKHVRTW